MGTNKPFELIILPDIQAVSGQAAEIFATLAHECDPFTMALSGGSTPGRLHEILGEPPMSERVPWKRVRVFWGDERCVPPEDPGSNYRMACETLLDHVPLPAENIHRMRGELGPDAAAEAYEKELRGFFQVPWPTFDLILLGMGNDGHTASLFPGSDILHETTQPVAGVSAHYQDRPARRVTLTPPAINAARHVVFLATGAEKAETLRSVLEGRFQPDALPAQVIRPTDGQLMWLVDSAAKVQHPI